MSWKSGQLLLICLCLGYLAIGSACNRLTTPESVQRIRDADTKAASGQLVDAIALYESALTDPNRSADVHYRLALLYDDKMQDPLNALHHFKRYLTLAPDGVHAADVKNFMRRDELALLTNLSGDTVMSRTEATRLRNENLALRKQLEDERLGIRATPAEKKKERRDKPGSTPQKAGTERRTYVIQQGDTLASISRRFYKSSARWKEILDANSGKIADPQNLKIGETLIIP